MGGQGALGVPFGLLEVGGDGGLDPRSKMTTPVGQRASVSRTWTVMLNHTSQYAKHKCSEGSCP